MLPAFLKSLLEKVKTLREENPTLAFVVLAAIAFWFYDNFKGYLKRRKSIASKVILITGGASGIGRLLALRCKQSRAKVIVWDINRAAIEEMREHVDSAEIVNVCNRDTVFVEAKKIIDKFGSIDILVNNAGVVAGKRILDLTEMEVRRTFEVNAISHFWTIQAFLPTMLQQKDGGHVVTIASTAGMTGVSHLTDYCASKYACRGLDAALRRELLMQGFDKKIKLTSICPYFINTGMFTGATSNASLFYKSMGIYFLEQEDVAKEIFDAILTEERQLVLSRGLGKIMALEHVFPYAIQDFLVNDANDMTMFVGH
jgi:all-trans-retinol dehydrogenase (NAD+)